MIEIILTFFQNLLSRIIIIPILLILTPHYYFSGYFKEHIIFSNISIYIRILFLIFYILLYIFSSKKHKKYVITIFLISYLCFSFFIVPKYLEAGGM